MTVSYNNNNEVSHYMSEESTAIHWQFCEAALSTLTLTYASVTCTMLTVLVLACLELAIFVGIKYLKCVPKGLRFLSM